MESLKEIKVIVIELLSKNYMFFSFISLSLLGVLYFPYLSLFVVILALEILKEYAVARFNLPVGVPVMDLGIIYFSYIGKLQFSFALILCYFLIKLFYGKTDMKHFTKAITFFAFALIISRLNYLDLAFIGPLIFALRILVELMLHIVFFGDLQLKYVPNRLFSILIAIIVFSAIKGI